MMSFAEAKIPKPLITDTAVVNFNQRQPDYKNLTSFEKEFYYWINYSRKNNKQFFDSAIAPIAKVYKQLTGDNYNSLKKDFRSSGFLPMLSLNKALNIMSSAHSADIVSHNAPPSHNSTNGKSFSERFKLSGLKNCGSENISYGAGEPLFLIALLYLDINIPELGHRKTLLNPSFVETGIGSSFYKDGNIFLVEDFACIQ